MRALLIDHHFQPRGAVQGSRWAHLCAESAALGLEWDVITAHQAAADTDSSGVRLHPTLRAKKWPGVLEQARHWHDSWRRPDGMAGWIPGAIATAKAVIGPTPSGPTPGDSGAFDLVVSSGGPVSAHVAGRAVARWSGLPWIADWTEPWGLEPISGRAAWVELADRQLERELVREADGVIVTTDALREVYRHDRIGDGTAEIDGDAITVIRAGFDALEMTRASQLSVAHGHRPRTRIVCTSDLGAQGQSINAVFEALAMNPQLADGLELVFAGPGNHLPYRRRSRRLGLQEHVAFLGDLSRPELLSLQLSSDVLLSLGFDSAYRINPEIAWYAACDRPVLHVRCTERDPSLELLGRLGRVLVCDSNRLSVLQALERAIRESWNGSGHARPDDLQWSALAEHLNIWLEGRVAVSRARGARRSPHHDPPKTSWVSGRQSSGD